jgi:hypothetical protein
VCFGVFELYNDRALENALDVALRMALTIPLDDISAYPKLSKAYYSFIEILFRNHGKTAFALDTNVFMQIMSTVHDGLQSNDAAICAFCANTIDHMASYYFTNQGKDKPEMINLQKVRVLTCPAPRVSLHSKLTQHCTARRRSPQSIFEFDGYTLQSASVRTASESLGRDASHA